MPDYQVGSFHIESRSTKSGKRFYPFTGDHLGKPKENSGYVEARKDGLVVINVDTSGDWTPDAAQRLAHALNCAADHALRG